jgi:hypothetical protein
MHKSLMQHRSHIVFAVNEFREQGAINIADFILVF